MASKQSDVTLNIKAGKNTALSDIQKTLDALESSKKVLAEIAKVSDKSALSTEQLQLQQKKLNEEIAKLKASASGVSALSQLKTDADALKAAISDTEKEIGDLIAQKRKLESEGKEPSKRQLAAIENQRKALQRLGEQYNKLQGAIKSAPANLNRIFPARELSLSRAAEAVGSPRTKELIDRNSGFSRLSVVEKEIATNKDVNALIQSRVALVSVLAQAQAKIADAEKKEIAAQQLRLQVSKNLAESERARAASNFKGLSQRLAEIKAQERALRQSAIDVRRASLQQTQFVGAVVKPGFSKFASVERGVTAQVAAQQKQEAAARAIFGYTSKISTLEKQRLPILSKLLGLFGQINAAQTKELSTQQKITAEHRKTSNAQKTGLAARLDAQRSSLDFYQRLRGQVLSLLSAYVGLYGVINQVSQAFDDQRRLVGIESKLSVLLDTTDATKIGDKLKFIQDQANRLGLDFLTLADNYSSFAISAKLTGASLDEIDLIFRKLSESARALNLNQVQTDLVFKATEQIFSKGKVYSEELRQQLGENLPGAFAAFAKSRKQAVADFVKDLGDGRIQAKEFIAFIYEYAEANGKGLGKALQSSSAELARFKNQYVILRNEFEKQVDPAFAASLKELTIALKDPATLESIKSIGLAAAETVKFLVEYRSEIGGVLKFIAQFYALKTVGKILKDIGSPLAALIKFFAGGVTAGGRFSAMIARLGALLTIAARAAGLLGLAIGAGAAGGGWLGNWLRDNSLLFEKFTNAVGVAFARLKAFSDYRNNRDSQEYKDVVAQIDAIEKLNKQSIDARGGKSIAEKRAQDLIDSANAVRKAFSDARNSAIEASKATGDLSEEQAQKLLDNAKKLETALNAYVKLNPDLNNFSVKSLIKNSADQIDILKNRGSSALQKLKDDVTVAKTNFESLTQSIKENNAALEEKLGETGLDTLDEKLKKVNKEYRDAIKNNEELRKKVLASKETSPSGKSNLIAEIDKGNAFALQTRNRELARIRKEENDRQEKEAEALANRRLELAKTLADKEVQIEKDKSSEAARAASKLEINAEYDKLINNVKSAYKGEDNLIAELIERIEKVRSYELQKVDSSLFDDFEKKAAERDRKVERIISRIQSGSVDGKKGQAQINEIYRESNKELEEIAKKLESLPGYTEEWKDRVSDVLTQTKKLDTAWGLTRQDVAETASGQLTDAFFSWSDGLQSASEAINSFFGSFFRYIAEAIARTAALKAAMALIGEDGQGGIISSFLGFASTGSAAAFSSAGSADLGSRFITAGIAHDGYDGNSFSRTRRVDPSVFTAGSRLGLSGDERAAIIKNDELVATRQEFNSMIAGMSSAGKQSSAPQAISIHNSFDAGDVFVTGAKSRGASTAIFNAVKANPQPFRKLLIPNS